MEFLNDELDITRLPKAEDLVLTSVDKRYFNVILFQKTILWLFVVAGVIVAISFYEWLQSTDWIVAIIAVVVLTIFTDLRVAYLSFSNKAFAVRDHDLIYQNGWLVKSFHVFPFNRIQHCSVDSGIFERWFGLSTLKVYTAGGDDSDIAISGLTVDQSSSLRELIIHRTNLNG